MHYYYLFIYSPLLKSTHTTYRTSVSKQHIVQNIERKIKHDTQSKCTNKNDWLNEWMNEWMNEWVNEWTNNRTNRKLIVGVNVNTCRISTKRHCQTRVPRWHKGSYVLFRKCRCVRIYSEQYICYIDMCAFTNLCPSIWEDQTIQVEQPNRYCIH